MRESASVFSLVLVICLQVLFLNNFLSFSFSFCFWREFVCNYPSMYVYICTSYVCGYTCIIYVFSFVNNADINCELNVIYGAPLADHVAFPLQGMRT